LIQQAYQAHLLQVGFVDRLIGSLIERLEETGLLDPSLIIITADHGVSFKTGGLLRPLTQDNYTDIIGVPLFVKLPHQKRGEVSDVNVQGEDLLPTIADVLQLELPWAISERHTIKPNRRI